MMILRATDYADAGGDPLVGARSCADAVIRALHDHERVVVDLEGVQGAASSYFNTLFLAVVDAAGAAALARLDLRTTSRILKGVSQRSRTAVLARHVA